jgi:hypothetical protein
MNRDYNESENYLDETSRTRATRGVIKVASLILLTLGLITIFTLTGCSKDDQYTPKKHKYKVTVGAFNANMSMTYNGTTIYPTQGQVIEFESRRSFSVTFTITGYPNSHGVTVERDGVWHQEERRSLENKGDKTYIIK